MVIFGRFRPCGDAAVGRDDQGLGGLSCRASPTAWLWRVRMVAAAAQMIARCV